MQWMGLFVSLLVLAGGVNYLPSSAQLPIQSIQSVQVSEGTTSSCNLENLPTRVGLQVGHWQNRELPEELARIRENDGAVVGDLMEWEAMYPIAEQAKILLEQQDVAVDLLPATVPIDYCAHAFVSVHADAGSSERTGYKAAGSAWDTSGSSDRLAESLELAYATATGLPYESTVTINMTRYYAFNSDRFNHAIHPQTPAALLETGFLTNEGDRQFLMNNTEKAAHGLAGGILAFLSPD